MEVGLVAAEVPVQTEHYMVIRMEEYSAKRTEINPEGRNKMSESSDITDIIKELDVSQKTQNSSPGGTEVNVISDFSKGMSFNEGTAVWFDPTKEVQKVEVEDKTEARVLLYRSIEMNREVSQSIFKAIIMAKVEPQLGAEAIAESGIHSPVGNPAHSVPHSARGSVTALVSARSFAARDASRTMSTANMVNQAQVSLNNTIMVHCETKDVEILPENDEDGIAERAAAAATSSVPAVMYDKNGRSHFVVDEGNGVNKQTVKNSKEKIGGFNTTFEEVFIYVYLFVNMNVPTYIVQIYLYAYIRKDIYNSYISFIYLYNSKYICIHIYIHIYIHMYIYLRLI
jgi:hypothetical protein